jgi:hypothetical protein
VFSRFTGDLQPALREMDDHQPEGRKPMTDPDPIEEGHEDDISLEDIAEAEERDTSAEPSGLEDEAATLADSELEDEANLPMEGQEFRLEEALPFADSDGDAGYDKEE